MAGGKSRKSGGVSKALINKIISGGTGKGKKGCGNNKPKKVDKRKKLFDEDSE